MKILAIDDSPTIRKFISKHLGAYSADYQILTAGSAEEGITIAKRELPRVILLDFILPDFNGDEVCRRLMDDPACADIPVILMSSSAPDIEKTEKQFKNIVRSMIKPFSPQLLCAGVSFVLKNEEARSAEASASAATPDLLNSDSDDADPNQIAIPAIEDASSTTSGAHDGTAAGEYGGKLLFCGNTGYFDMVDALHGIEFEKASGVLELNLHYGICLVWFRDGLPHLVSTTSSEAYLAGSQLNVPPESQNYFAALKNKQNETGMPIFLQMGQDGAIDLEQAAKLTAQYGNYAFAHAYTQPPFAFKFFEDARFPSFVPDSPCEKSMTDWITCTLRSVDQHHPAVKAGLTPDDILSFTADGYKLIQTLSLTEQEVAFASQVGSGGSTLRQIAESVNLQWHEACRILFLFTRTRVVEVWQTAG